MKKKRHTLALIRNRSIRWLTGVVLQGQRILTSPKPPNPYVIGCDGHFFAIALSHAVFWLDQFGEEYKKEHPEIREYQIEFSEAKNVRAMLEHDDEYVIGEGRKQDEYLTTLPLNSGKLTVKGLHPFTVVTSDEGVSLGGRLSVNKACELSAALLTILSDA